MTKLLVKKESTPVIKPKKPEGMSIEEFNFVAQNVKKELLIVEFKQSQEAKSCINEVSMQRHQHRLHIISENFSAESALAKKFTITQAPDIVVMKTAANTQKDWTSGLDSLMLILQTIEAEEEIKLKETIKQDKERKAARIAAMEEARLNQEARQRLRAEKRESQQA